MTDPPHRTVKVLCIFTVKAIHELRHFPQDIIHKEMYVCLHQCICNDINAIVSTEFLKKIKVLCIVFVSNEDRLAVIAPCIYMMI